jgi:hypothetical protein
VDAVELPGEVLGVPRAPHAHVCEPAYEPQSLEMASRLHPEPMIASTDASGRARYFVATADTATVRTSVIRRPSMLTSGCQVSVLKRRTSRGGSRHPGSADRRRRA